MDRLQFDFLLRGIGGRRRSWKGRLVSYAQSQWMGYANIFATGSIKG
jgi:hypothetical protein